MNEIEEKEEFISEGEVGIIDILAICIRRKWLIIGITVFAMVAVVVYSIISLKLPSEKSYLPNVYKAEAQMLINDNNNSGGVSAAISSSGLGSILGLSSGGGASNSSLAIYLVYSNTILDSVVEKFDLVTKGKITKEPIASSRDYAKKMINTSFNKDTGIFTISCVNKDPYFAKDVVNYVVELLEQRFAEIGIDKNKLTKMNLEENIKNSYDEILKLQMQIQELEMSVSDAYNPNYIPSIVMDTSLLKLELNVQEQIYTSLKSQYENLKVMMASEKPVFQTLEYAAVEDRKAGPSRGKLCMSVSFGAFCFSLVLVFILHLKEKVKNNPEIQKKLRGK